MSTRLKNSEPDGRRTLYPVLAIGNSFKRKLLRAQGRRGVCGERERGKVKGWFGERGKRGDSYVDKLL